MTGALASDLTRDLTSELGNDLRNDVATSDLIGASDEAGGRGMETTVRDQAVSGSKRSKGGRWANLPPELMAIKDRWLGASSEDIIIPPVGDDLDATTTTAMVAAPPVHEDLPQQRQPRQQPSWPEEPDRGVLNGEPSHGRPLNGRSSHGGALNGGPSHGRALNGRSSHGGALNGEPSHGGALNGGSSHGGALNGGPSRGGALNGGSSYGGASNGGPSHGGALNGGPSHGGALIGGPSPEGSFHGGLSLGGALNRTAAEETARGGNIDRSSHTAMSTDSLERGRQPGSDSVSSYEYHRGTHRPNGQQAQNLLGNLRHAPTKHDDQGPQNVSDKRPSQRQENSHHVPTKHDAFQPASFGHQTLDRKMEADVFARVMEPQEMIEKKSGIGNQRAQNVSDKRPSQRQELLHHVPMKHDHIQLVSFGHHTFHRESEAGATNVATILEPQEKKSNIGSDVSSATMLERKNSTGFDNSAVKMMRRQEGAAGRPLAKGVKERFEMKQAPAYGDAVGGHAGNGSRREKVRNHLRDLKNRLPCMATGSASPAGRPTRNQGDGISTSPPTANGVVGVGNSNTVTAIGAAKQPSCASAKTGTTRPERFGGNTGATRNKTLGVDTKVTAEQSSCASANIGTTQNTRLGIDTDSAEEQSSCASTKIGTTRQKRLGADTGLGEEQSSCVSVEIGTTRKNRLGIANDLAEEQSSCASTKIGATRDKRLGADTGSLCGPTVRGNAVVERTFHQDEEQSVGETTVLQHERRRGLEPSAAEAESDDDISTVLINETHAEGGGETGSTRSRLPSELFDSLDLDLSVSDPRNGNIFANTRNRREITIKAENMIETEVAATARIENSPTADSASQALRSQDSKDLGVAKAFGDTGNERAADAAVALSFKSRAQPPFVDEITEATPKQRAWIPESGSAADDSGVNSQPSELRPDRAVISRERRLDRAHKGSATDLQPPDRAFDRPPTGTHRDRSDNPGNRSYGKPRGQPGVSRLMAPGWGRDVVINSIPSASIISIPPAPINSIPPAYSSVGGVGVVGGVGEVGGVGGVGGVGVAGVVGVVGVVGAVKVNTPSAAATFGAKGPASAMFLPRDLLTPVTEVATVDEHSVVSCSTRRTARNTPASSIASGETKTKHAASGAPFRSPGTKTKHSAPGAAMRGRLRSPSPSGDHNRLRRGDDGAYRTVSPEEPSDGRRRCRQGGEKRRGWGVGSVGSAQSAPGEGTASAPGCCKLASGSVRSLSSNRSPLCGAGDGRFTRVSNGHQSHLSGGLDGRFTSVSNGHQSPNCGFGGRLTSLSGGRRKRRGRGGQAGGDGYIAAMSRRARSVARCEAARRLAAVKLAANKARPSTPISERARWGKGRESQVEVERRKLLRRRSEYADELQRKAKEEAEALAAENGEPSTIPNKDGRRIAMGDNSPMGCEMQSTPRAVGANAIYATAALKAVDEPQGNFHRLSLGGPMPFPTLQRRNEHDCGSGGVVNGDGSASRSSAGGRTGSGSVSVAGNAGSVTGKRNFPGKFSVSVPQEETGSAGAPATAEREEQQLMASIARLDVLLQDDRAPPPAGKSRPSRRISAASKSSAISGDVTQTEISQGSGRGRKPARSGGIAKTRVRKGSRTETKISDMAQAEPAVPADSLSTSAVVPAATVPAAIVPAAIVPAAVPPITATPVAGISAAITGAPVVFPPLVRGETVCSGETTEQGRYLPGVNGSNGNNGNGHNNGEADGDSREHCREDGRLREPLRAYDRAPVPTRGVQITDEGRVQNIGEGRGWGGRDRENLEASDCCRPRDVVRPSFAPGRRAVETDQYGSNGEGWTEPIPSAPARYRDARYRDDRVDTRCRDCRGGVMGEYPYCNDYDPREGGGQRPGGGGRERSEGGKGQS